MSGPLVVRGDRWILPSWEQGSMRGETPAGMGARVDARTVFVMGPPARRLWAESATAEVIGQEDRREPWRYRVTMPGRSQPITLVVLSHDTSRKAGPWANLTGMELAAALRALEGLLGVPWSHSVGRTAEHLILSTHPRSRGGARLDREPDVPAPCRAGIEQPHAMWQRPLLTTELGAGWVHTFDANAAYLGAWQTTELGLGPVHAWRGDADELRRAGVWRVRLPAGWREPDDLPAIAPALRRGSGWVMTPTLARLREHAESSGFPELLPEEGWVWARQSRFLRAAGERLRDARAAALAQEIQARCLLGAATSEAELDAALLRLEVAGRVRDAVGELYRVTNGRLSITDEGFVSPGWRRPDWANALRATFRVSLHRKISRWSVRPFALRTDAVAFATDEPDAHAFAAAAGLRLGSGLGELKHAGTVPLAAVEDVLGRGRLHGGEVFARAGRFLRDGTLGSPA